MNNKSVILVVFGTGSDKKPHASQFEGADEALVRKAASLMGFRVGRAETDEARALAKKLPEGKVFAAGRAFVPYVKQDLYDKVRGLLILEPPPAANPSPAAAASMAPPNRNETKVVAASPCDPWAAIGVGSVVLCRDQTKDAPSWWEAVVVAMAKDGNTMTMRWLDYPKQKQFVAKRRSVAVIGDNAIK